MTELEHAIKHIKTRADAWAVKEVTEALQSVSERLDKALSQEPCDDVVSRILKRMWNCRGKHTTSIDKVAMEQIIRDELSVMQKPIECDDVVSREAALEKMADYVASGYADSAEDFEEYSRIICQLPSVTQKSGKWIRWREEVQRGTHYTENVPHCKCSECDKEYDIFASRFINYCPNCGAKMESGVKE